MVNVAVQAPKISRVLLSDGWHDVQPGTFNVGNLLFTEAAKSAGAGSVIAPIGREILAAQWREEKIGDIVTVAVSAILAIQGG